MPSGAPVLADLQRIKGEWDSFTSGASGASVPRESLALLWAQRAAMTLPLLRDSGIGKALTALKKKLAGEDLKLAQELLLSWKASSGVVPASPSLSRASSLQASPAAPAAAAAAVSPAPSSATPTASLPASATASPVPMSDSAAAAASAAPSLAAAIAAVAPVRASSGLDVLAESRKRKAEQLAAAAQTAAAPAEVGGDRKRVSLMPPGAAAARPAVEIPYPVATASAPAAAAPPLPSQDAFFTRPASSPVAANRHPAGTVSTVSSGKKSVLPARGASIGGPDDLRSKVRLQLCRAFDSAAPPTQTEFSDVIVETAAEIEAVMFGLYRGDTGAAYRNKSREMAMSIKDPRNPALRQRVLNGEISVHDLLTLPFTELASEELRGERDAAKKWEMAERRSDLTPHVTVTDAFRCGKCRERQCSYYQMQTRSADEPMTTFVRCVKCGNRWRC